MHEPEHRPWLLDVVRLLVGLAGLFFIVGSLGAFDLHALAEDGAEPNPVLFALGWVLLCIAFLITLAPQRQTYPGLYAFVGALLGSALFATIALSVVLRPRWDMRALLLELPFIGSALCCLMWAGVLWWRWWRVIRGSHCSVSSPLARPPSARTPSDR